VPRARESRHDRRVSPHVPVPRSAGTRALRRPARVQRAYRKARSPRSKVAAQLSCWSDTAQTPKMPSKERCQLRVNLIAEELNELQDAIKAGDLVEVADALWYLRHTRGQTRSLAREVRVLKRLRNALLFTWNAVARLSLDVTWALWPTGCTLSAPAGRDPSLSVDMPSTP
jgi:hypothetical protein